MATKHCPNCGAAMPAESKFCTECGMPFPKADKQETEPLQNPQAAVQPQPQAQAQSQPQPQSQFQPQPQNQPYNPGSARVDNPPQNARPAQAYGYTPNQGVPAAGSAWQQNPANVRPAGAMSGTVTEARLKGTPFEPVSSFGWFGIILLMSIPVVNLIAALIWVFGGCRKKIKQSYARGWLIKLLFDLVIAALLVLLAWKLGTALLIRLADENGIAYNAGTEVRDIIDYFVKYGIKITFSEP